MEEKRRKEWADYYYKWVEDNWSARGEKLDLGTTKDTKRPYLKQIYQDQSPEIVYIKSAQVGATERMLTEALWLADQYKENCLYVFPTSSTMSDLVQTRVDEPINFSPYLLGVAGRARKIMAKQADKVGLKRLSKGFIYFRGSNTPTQITSVDVDMVVADEVDRMLQSSVPYIEKRLLNSKRKWSRFGSTPTIPNFGIDLYYKDTNQQEWHIKCNHCGVWQHLNFYENIIGDYDENTRKVTNEAIICSKCKGKLVPYQCEGKWIAKKPENEKVGYFIHQLYAPNVNLKQLIRNSNSTNEEVLTQFHNQDLGEPYEPEGSKVTEANIEACKRDYRIPLKEEVCYMGVDVGKVLHYVIRGENRILDIGKVKEFSDIDRLVQAYQPRAFVVDALPETRKAIEIVNKYQGRGYICYYSGYKEMRTDKEDEQLKWIKADEHKVNTDRTISLDYSLGEIIHQNIEMPKNIDDYVEFKNQVKALNRITRLDTKGNSISEYVQTGDDHYGHANNYARIAKQVFIEMTEPEPELMII